MSIKTDRDDLLLLRPYEEEEAENMIEGLQSLEVCQYIELPNAQTLPDEKEFLQKCRDERNRRDWAVCVDSDGISGGKAIGTLSLTLDENMMSKARFGETGMVIYDRNYWGVGIFSAAALARTLYAFDIENVSAIHSTTLRSNKASVKVLNKLGYVKTGTRYRSLFISGQVIHKDEYLQVNPVDESWNSFWGKSEIPKKFIRARDLCISGLLKAREQVKFP